MSKVSKNWKNNNQGKQRGLLFGGQGLKVQPYLKQPFCDATTINSYVLSHRPRSQGKKSLLIPLSIVATFPSTNMLAGGADMKEE